MTAQSRRHHDRKAGPAGSPRHATQQVPPGDNSAAAADRSGQDPHSGRLTGLSRDLLYDEMRRGNLAYVKVGRRRLITRQHLNQFLGIAS